MKKLLSVFFLATLLISILSVSVSASSSEQVSLEYLEDGSYFETSVISESNPFARAGKSGSKSTTYYNGSNVKMWTLTVTGTFSYNGSSSSATAASGTLSTYVTGCSVGNKAFYKSGNSVVAYATVNGIYKTVTLRCSASGVLS